MSRLESRRAMLVGGPLAISALATILLAAVDPERNMARIKAMPIEERQRLVENLRKFDLLYVAREQQAIRELDRRLDELEPDRRAQYLAVLRRYHNWLNKLADAKRDELRTMAPGERMALIKKLLVDNPVPRADTPQFLKVTDMGDYSPFELAAIYKIWQFLTADQRQQVDRMANPSNRRSFLTKIAERKSLPREIVPSDFAEPSWITRMQGFLQKTRPGILRAVEDVEKKKKDAAAVEFVRRLAINHYFAENPGSAVTPERLAQFLAGYPSWVQSTFDSYPPDEARRRLTIAYRLVFPHPEEIPPAKKKAGSAPISGTAPAPGAPRSNSKPARPDSSAPQKSPF
jgi:hypothetical protein